MMMQGRHREHAFARQLERHHLDKDRNGLQHEQTADDRQYQLVFVNHANGAQLTAQRQRTSITHENLGWMTIKPEEAKAGTDKGHHNNAELR